MKALLIVVCLLITVQSIGQIENSLKGQSLSTHQRYTEFDTIPTVVYLKDKKSNKMPIFFLNGEKVSEHVVATLNTKKIEELTIDEDPENYNIEEFSGAIHITLKDNYKPQLITINQLKSKYLELSNVPCIYYFNGKVIHEDYDTYLVDEKYILKIEVENIKMSKENIDLNIIRLITRTEENLKKANTILIRGN